MSRSMEQEEEGEQEQEQQQHRHEPFRSLAALGSRQGGGRRFARLGFVLMAAAGAPPPDPGDVRPADDLCGSGTTARQTSSWSFGTNRTNIKTQHKCLRTQGCDKGQCSDSGTSCAAAAARLAIIRLAAAFVRRFIYARNGPVPATTVGRTVLWIILSTQITKRPGT